jgi:hypothetical protein
MTIYLSERDKSVLLTDGFESNAGIILTPDQTDIAYR